MEFKIGGRMRNLNDQELQQLKGGFSLWAGIGIAAIVVFLAGVLEGIVHPRTCGE